MGIMQTLNFQQIALVAVIIVIAFALIILFFFVKSQIQKKKEKKIATASAIAKNEWKTCYQRMGKYLETAHKFYRRRKEQMPPEIEKEFIQFRNICISVIVYAEPIPTKEEITDLIKEYKKLESSIRSRMLQGKSASTIKAEAIETMKVINEEILQSLQRILVEISK